MRISTTSKVLNILLLGALSYSAVAYDSKGDAPIRPSPVFFGLSKPKPQPPTDAKPIETKHAWIPQDRKAGTITVKPLGVNVSGLTFGIAKKNQIINGYPKDFYKSSFGCFSNQAQAFGFAYDFELGVMVTSNIEAFIIAGLEYQRGMSKLVISNNNTAVFGGFLPLFGLDQLAYDFKTRRNYSFSLGGRYYWNTQKPWFPFVGLMGTVIRQDAIRANVFSLGLVGFNNTYPLIGPYQLQPRKYLVGGTLQAGADYQITDHMSASFVIGLQYTPRTRWQTTAIFNPLDENTPIGPVPTSGIKNISNRDNRNFWSVPIMVALKFTL